MKSAEIGTLVNYKGSKDVYHGVYRVHAYALNAMAGSVRYTLATLSGAPSLYNVRRESFKVLKEGK